MNPCYVDTSVLLRVVLRQPNPLREWRSITPVSSTLIEVEAMRALEREQVEGNLTSAETDAKRADVREVLRGFRLIEMDMPVVERAAQPFGANLRALDAIHLATALLLRQRDELPGDLFATHDIRSRFAATARAFGFKVIGA